MIPRADVACLAIIALGACTTTPTRPPSEFLQPLDLVCKPQVAGSEELIFHVIPGGDGDAIVVRMNSTELEDFSTHTYENALTWSNGKESFAAVSYTHLTLPTKRIV